MAQEDNGCQDQDAEEQALREEGDDANQRPPTLRGGSGQLGGERRNRGGTWYNWDGPDARRGRTPSRPAQASVGPFVLRVQLQDAAK